MKSFLITQEQRGILNKVLSVDEWLFKPCNIAVPGSFPEDCCEISFTIDMSVANNREFVSFLFDALRAYNSYANSGGNVSNNRVTICFTYPSDSTQTQKPIAKTLSEMTQHSRIYSPDQNGNSLVELTPPNFLSPFYSLPRFLKFFQIPYKEERPGKITAPKFSQFFQIPYEEKTPDQITLYYPAD